jgi:hypothetical protein
MHHAVTGKDGHLDGHSRALYRRLGKRSMQTPDTWTDHSGTGCSCTSTKPTETTIHPSENDQYRAAMVSPNGIRHTPPARTSLSPKGRHGYEGAQFGERVCPSQAINAGWSPCEERPPRQAAVRLLLARGSSAAMTIGERLS